MTSTPTLVDTAAALTVVCVGYNSSVSVWYYLILSFFTFCFLYFDKERDSLLFLMLLLMLRFT